jgi:NAD(P)-dependent dehydrogenase (short-subunit alcohol dehydrogenase family)
MSDTTTLILGGTSGVGLATARLLAASGATVHVAGRGTERLREIAQTDPQLVGHQVDATDRDAVERLARSLGRIDQLILAFSGSEGMGPIATLDLSMLRRAYDAKFWGYLTSIQAVLPHLAPEGSITVLGAVSARAAMAGTAGIGSLNAAVEALVKPLAVELAPIRVNAVSPGVVDTPWWSGFPDGVRREFFAQTAAALPTGRIAGPEDIAEAVVFVARNANMTGTVIEADGGARLVSIG